jgi:ATP-dependent exoDNAse (exonuclease V) alpha subunit
VKTPGLHFNNDITVDGVVKYVEKLIENIPSIPDRNSKEANLLEQQLCKAFPLVMIPKRDLNEVVSKQLRNVWLKKFDPLSYSNLEYTYEDIVIGDRLMITKNIYEEIDENGNIVYHLEEETEDLDFEKLKELEEQEGRKHGTRVLFVANGQVVLVRKVKQDHLIIETLTASGLPSGKTHKFIHLKVCKNCYSNTVHKSQGSEAENSVVVLGNPEQNGKPFWFTGRKFAYTALTRSMTHCELFSTIEGLVQIVKRDDIYVSNLRNRIEKLLKEAQENPEKRENENIDDEPDCKKQKKVL